jgi:signal transduction histidine kinase
VTVERLRIARDLHDLLAHCITSISVQAAVASHLISVGGEQSDLKVLAKALDAITETCGEARDELQATLGVLRDSLETVHPLNARTALPGLSRLAELAEPVRLSGIEVTFQTEGRVRSLPPTVDVVAYRIVQEALTNVVKHSGASQTTVALHYLPESLRVTVTDDGRRGAPPAGGYGITGMIERARAVGGSLSARSRVTGGFLVTAELPTGRPEVMGHDDPRPAS